MTLPAFSGLKASIVDFGLSRVDRPMASADFDKDQQVRSASPRDPYFAPIPEDVLDGIGEQWDIYRETRDLVDTQANGDWSVHLPITNLMWLRHLIRVLLYSTRTLKKPKTRKQQKGAQAEGNENEACHAKLVELEKTIDVLLQLAKDGERPRTRAKRSGGGRNLSITSKPRNDVVPHSSPLACLLKQVRTEGWNV